jgi:hypothetical protein
MVDPHKKFRVPGEEELNSDASEVGRENRIYWRFLIQKKKKKGSIDVY